MKRTAVNSNQQLYTVSFEWPKKCFERMMAAVRTVKDRKVVSRCAFDETLISLIGLRSSLHVLQSISIDQKVKKKNIDGEADTRPYRRTNKSLTIKIPNPVEVILKQNNSPDGFSIFNSQR